MFIGLLILTIALLVQRDQVVAWATENMEENNKSSIDEIHRIMTENLKVTSYNNAKNYIYILIIKKRCMFFLALVVSIS